MANNALKRLALTAAAAGILAASLTSCDGLPDISLVKKDKETTTTTTQLTEDLTVWKDKYEEFLMGVMNGTQTVTSYTFEVEECHFDMAFVDDDDIPEILISEGAYPGSKVSIFSYDGYDVREVGSVGSNGCAEYVEKINIILSKEEYEDLSQLTVYSIDEYKLKEAWQGAVSTEGEQTKYLINNVEVSKEDYQVQYDLYQFNNVSTIGTDSYPITAQYIMDVIESDEKPALPETTTVPETEETEEETSEDITETGEEITDEYGSTVIETQTDIYTTY